MKILVTGGAGFIASNITDELIKQNHEVVIVDDLSNGKKENINPNAIFEKIDVGSQQLSNVFQTHQPDVIIHHAAQIDVRKSVANPEFDYKINVEGGVNILKNCVKNDVSKIIFASSGGAIYGNPQDIPVDETCPANPLSPYGAHKLEFEEILKQYEQQHNIQHVSLRYSNVYGPRQNPHGEAGVVAIFTNKMMNNETPKIFGNGCQTRDYVYVKDVVDANMKSIKYEKSGIFNIGVGIETSVNQIYEKLKTITKSDIEALHTDPMNGEVEKISLDCQLAKQELGWKPKTKIDKGLEKTVEWAKQTI